MTRPLLAGALRTFERHGASPGDVTVAWVPGAFELGAVTKAMARTGRFDAVLALGAVVRGDTTHYDAVAGAAANGVLGASMDTGVPCIFGVLTCARARAAVPSASSVLPPFCFPVRGDDPDGADQDRFPGLGAR